LPGGPVCPPARWAATSNVEEGQFDLGLPRWQKRGREGWEEGRGMGEGSGNYG